MLPVAGLLSVFCSCPTDSLVVVVGGLVAAILVLMLCYLCTALFCLWKTRRGEVVPVHCVVHAVNNHRHYMCVV